MGFGYQGDRGRGRSRLEVAGSSAVRVVMLFGSAAVALALVAAQVIDNRIKDYVAAADAAPGVDQTTTGTIGYRGSYTIRKSVLQDTPGSICILRDNGTTSGDC